MADPLRHRQTKGAATDMVDLTPPRHIPTLPNRANLPAAVEVGYGAAPARDRFTAVAAVRRRFRPFAAPRSSDEARPKHDVQRASRECPALEKAAVTPSLSPCGLVALMIAVRDPTEVSRNRSFEVLRCRINTPRPGFEQAILQMQAAVYRLPSGGEQSGRNADTFQG
jgi:hypothetical protein